MTQATDKIIDRIKKLLALAASANENEASAAAMKAAELLAEHNLSEADLGTVDNEDMILDGELLSDSRPWRRALAGEVARLYFCDYFYGWVKETRPSRKCGYKRYDRHSFAGRKHNVLIAKTIFMYLCDTIDRLAVAAANKHGTRGRGAFMGSFRHACADRLSERIRDKWYEASQPIHGGLLIDDGAKLPVLYSTEADKVAEFMTNEVGPMKEVAFVPKLHSLLGAMAGHKAGDEIGLDVQLQNEQAGAFMLGGPDDR